MIYQLEYEMHEEDHTDVFLGLPDRKYHATRAEADIYPDFVALARCGLEKAGF